MNCTSFIEDLPAFCLDPRSINYEMLIAENKLTREMAEWLKAGQQLGFNVDIQGEVKAHGTKGERKVRERVTVKVDHSYWADEIKNEKQG